MKLSLVYRKNNKSSKYKKLKLRNVNGIIILNERGVSNAVINERSYYCNFP